MGAAKEDEVPDVREGAAPAEPPREGDRRSLTMPRLEHLRVLRLMVDLIDILLARSIKDASDHEVLKIAVRTKGIEITDDDLVAARRVHDEVLELERAVPKDPTEESEYLRHAFQQLELLKRRLVEWEKHERC